MRTRTSPFAAIDATGIQRAQRPHGAVAFQLATYAQPAAAIPSAYAHVIVRGLATMQAAPVGGPGGATPNEHRLCEWDFLESPTLYGRWVPLPGEVEALEIVAGANPACTGVVTRGYVTWLLGENR